MLSRSPRSLGVTLVEVLIAIAVLGIGILALTGSSALVTRMIGRGKIETQAALRAAHRVELLRAMASGTTPRCQASAFAGGGPILLNGSSETWVVSPTGSVRTVRVTVSYLTTRGLRSAVVETRIAC
jgi:prepilin-type N-terminal cleavage/methylation domain-containing protein